MPIPQVIQINPLDLQGNIAIGISLPFNGPAVFNSTYSTQDQIKSNLINLLLTNKGERIMNPEFGADLRRLLFEGIIDNIEDIIENLIYTSVSFYIPEISIIDLIIDKQIDQNLISILLRYKINLSGNTDQITLQFI